MGDEDDLHLPVLTASETSPSSSPRPHRRSNRSRRTSEHRQHRRQQQQQQQQLRQSSTFDPAVAARPAGVVAALRLCLAAAESSPDVTEILAVRSPVIPLLLRLLCGESTGDSHKSDEDIPTIFAHHFWV